MKKISFIATSILMVFIMSFQSLQNINPHSYSVGFDNYHISNKFSCFGFEKILSHYSYECGKAFHINF